jgi:hypothetical protein
MEKAMSDLDSLFMLIFKYGSIFLIFAIKVLKIIVIIKKLY